MTGSLAGFSSGKPWPFKIANGYRIRATRVERASRRGVQRIGKRQAKTCVRNAEPWLRGKNGGEERLRIRMFRARKQSIGVGKLDNPAQIHDRHPGCDVLHHCEVMANKHVSQLELATQIRKQIENLRLHRYIQRRSRLVAY